MSPPPPPPPPPNFRQNIDCKGLNFKIFRNKDLAPRIASENEFGQFRGFILWVTARLGNRPNQGSIISLVGLGVCDWDHALV